MQKKMPSYASKNANFGVMPSCMPSCMPSKTPIAELCRVKMPAEFTTKFAHECREIEGFGKILVLQSRLGRGFSSIFVENSRYDLTDHFFSPIILSTITLLPDCDWCIDEFTL